MVVILWWINLYELAAVNPLICCMLLLLLYVVLHLSKAVTTMQTVLWKQWTKEWVSAWLSSFSHYAGRRRFLAHVKYWHICEIKYHLLQLKIFEKCKWGPLHYSKTELTDTGGFPAGAGRVVSLSLYDIYRRLLHHCILTLSVLKSTKVNFQGSSAVT